MTTTPTADPATAGHRIEFLDILRVAAMSSVVFLHSAAGTLTMADGSAVWHFANVVTSLVSASIPLFFMISGALLLDSQKTASVSYTLKSRVPRLVVPLLVWSLLYVAYYLFKGWEMHGYADWGAARDKLVHLPGAPVIVPLWFMYAITALYILSPLVKRMVDSLSRDLAIYLVALWLLFSSLLPTIAVLVPASVSPLFVLPVKYDLNLLAGYLGYFIVGYYLMKIERPVSKAWLTAAICLDTALIAVGTWWKTSSLGEYSEVLKTYSFVFTLIMSVSLFLLVKELMRERQMGRVARRVFGILAPLAFGVYLIHPMLIDRFTSWSAFDSVGKLVGYYLAELAASVACIAVLSAIRPLRYMLVGQSRNPWSRRGERDDN